MDNYDVKKLKSLVINAFIGVKYPGRDAVYHSIAGKFELEKILKSDQDWHDDWRNVPYELVWHHCSSLPFFSSEGYPFFIPVYLLTAIDSIGDNESKYDIVLMYVMYDLCNYCDPSDKFFEHAQYQHSKLTQKQKKAIHEFLHFVLIYSNDDEYIKLAQKTIDLGIYIE